MTDYSLSDIAAVTGSNNNDGMFGGNGAWWIVLFLIFAAFGWGGNGFGGFGGGSQGAADNYVLASDFATIQRQLSDGFSGVEKGLDTIRNGLCDGFYTQAQLVNGVNMNIMQGFNATQAQLAQCCCDTREAISGVNYNMAMNANALQRQIADCCCSTERQIERGFADTNYNMATQNCATLQAIDKVGDRVIDYLAQDKMQTLRDENQALRLAASQAAQNNFLVNELRPCPIPAYITCNPFASTNYVNGCGCGNVA